jgi:hypothetical protein
VLCCACAVAMMRCGKVKSQKPRMTFGGSLHLAPARKGGRGVAGSGAGTWAAGGRATWQLRALPAAASQQLRSGMILVRTSSTY